ncbi:MAG TPA: hypothetical protein VIH88_07155 [Candidatus Acidoferrales bacterium]
MKYVIFGMLDSYGDAEAAVQDLEVAGIAGGQVEVISEIDEDARTANTPGEPSTNSGEPQHSWIARLFGARGAPEKREVRDESGAMPDYIGEQEYYASHIKQGGAVVVVRTTAEQAANRAAAILHEHGARTPGSKDGPVVRRIE